MDILTHTLSGVAVATCAASFAPKAKDKIALLGVGALGGAFADIDAISLWSHFDSTFGKTFNLTMKGSEIYSAKLWYSHHAFFHSLLGSLLFGIIFLLFLFLFRKKDEALSAFVKGKTIYFIAFVVAYWAHLAGDLPTPSSAWGGISFFWPSLNYVGGYGTIWWWNNYDIFLLIVACIALNLLFLLFSGYLKSTTKKLVIVSFSLFLLLIVYQTNTRQHSYAYTTEHSRYAEMEKKSKEEQQRILEKKLYNFMEAFDRKIKFYF